MNSLIIFLQVVFPPSSLATTTLHLLSLFSLPDKSRSLAMMKATQPSVKEARKDKWSNAFLTKSFHKMRK